MEISKNRKYGEKFQFFHNIEPHNFYGWFEGGPKKKRSCGHFIKNGKFEEFLERVNFLRNISYLLKIEISKNRKYEVLECMW